jgi:hypothetical protein
MHTFGRVSTRSLSGGSIHRAVQTDGAGGIDISMLNGRSGGFEPASVRAGISPSILRMHDS